MVPMNLEEKLEHLLNQIEGIIEREEIRAYLLGIVGEIIQDFRRSDTPSLRDALLLQQELLNQSRLLTISHLLQVQEVWDGQVGQAEQLVNDILSGIPNERGEQESD